MGPLWRATLILMEMDTDTALGTWHPCFICKISLFKKQLVTFDLISSVMFITYPFLFLKLELIPSASESVLISIK